MRLFSVLSSGTRSALTTSPAAGRSVRGRPAGRCCGRIWATPRTLTTRTTSPRTYAVFFLQNRRCLSHGQGLVPAVPEPVLQRFEPDRHPAAPRRRREQLGRPNPLEALHLSSAPPSTGRRESPTFPASEEGGRPALWRREGRWTRRMCKTFLLKGSGTLCNTARWSEANACSCRRGQAAKDGGRGAGPC
jgi:hypothetical protein